MLHVRVENTFPFIRMIFMSVDNRILSSFLVCLSNTHQINLNPWIHSLFLSVFSVKISHQVRFSITTDESILSFQTKSFSSTLLDNLLDEPSHFKISLPVHFFIMNSFSLFRHHSLHVCKTILSWTSWVSVASRYQMNFPPLSVWCNYETFHFKNILHESFLFKFLLLWVRFSVNRHMILWYCSTSTRRPWTSSRENLSSSTLLYHSPDKQLKVLHLSAKPSSLVCLPTTHKVNDWNSSNSSL